MITCSAPSEVASAIRRGLLSGGPVLGQVAAYTLAMVAAAARRAGPRRRGITARCRRHAARCAANEPLAGRGAIERMASGPAGQGDGATLARSLLDEADQIASEAALDHARLGQLAADALRRWPTEAAADDRPLGVLMHGDQGPLTGGQVGAALPSCSRSAHPANRFTPG
jgi:methylthioribose-1-phosphate isomerase